MPVSEIKQDAILSQRLLDAQVGVLGSMLPMMAVGWIADHWGINAAVTAFACFVMVLGTVLGLAFARHPRMRAAC